MLDWWDPQDVVNSQLRGVFIGDEAHPELDNHIFLLYRFSGNRWFTSFEAILQDCDYFVTTYEPDKQDVMFVFDVPEKYQESYTAFKQSKYSQIQEKLKKRIVEFHGEQYTEKIVAVMYKHESMYLAWEKKLNENLPSSQHVRIPRDQEASTVLDMSLEVYSKAMSKEVKGISAKGEQFLKRKGEEDAD